MTNRELVEIAKKVRENAYAPYSKFKVGAALLAEDGTVFTGCNVENASYGAGICAERTAVTKGVSEGYNRFVKIAIVSSSDAHTYPCGICRQVLAEFMLDGTVVVDDKEKGIKEVTLKELLPEAFTGEDMNL